MTIQPTHILLAAMVLSLSTTGPTLSDPILDAAAISSALARPGKLMPGDVYRVGLPRTDLHVTIDGLTLRPGSSLEDSGFHVTALHNHLLNETPHVMYMHYMRVGDAAAMSADLARALALTKMPPAPPASAAPAAATEFASEDVIEGILGHKGTVAGGVLSIGVPRAETISLTGMTLPPSMGVANAMNFEPADAGRVATTGDFVLIATEVPLVQESFKAHGFLATALHQHMLGDSPTLYYMHFYAVGTPEMIAAGLKDALSHLNVRP